MNGDFSLVPQSVPYELTEDRWRRLEALFHAARELDVEDRSLFLDAETAGDLELRRQIEEMLAQSGSAAGLLAGTVSAVARRASGSADLAGRRVGPYRLVREIGRGGMGVVYEACRDDDEYRKTVALKLAPAWRDWETLSDRLRHERQILAELEHPNIARFLEGGSQDGVPYFVMEYVPGSQIVEYCRMWRLGIRARVELFRHVCAAVHYAHERLVVHRDLKPANILVTRDGVPKLLDFGIAKLLTPVAGDTSITAGLRLWTPDYTSPEQVRGGAITTRTDVYLLGLVLYELLCEEKAQEVDPSTPLALDRSVCEAEAPLPSQRAAAKGATALARQLRGDLDTIVAMAIRKEPERRYGSAVALSEDLARFLDGRPVEARPGSAAYRIGKLVRRHRAAVAAGMLVVLSTTAGVVATVYQARRAERRFQEVRRLANSVLFGVDDRIRNLVGATEAREWAVSNALQYLNELAKDAGRDRALQFELATAYQKVGDVQGYGGAANLGNTAAALDSHRKALTLAQTLAAGDPDPKIRRLLARAYQRVAALSQGQDKKQTTLDQYRRARAIEDTVYAANPDSIEDADLLTSILLGQGLLEYRLGEAVSGAQSFARALEVATRRGRQSPGNAAEATQVRIRRMLVRGHLYTGDLAAAERLAKENLETSERLVTAEPANAIFRRDLMNSYVEMAYVYWHSVFLNFEEPQTALPYHEKAVAMARELAAKDPSNANAQTDLEIAEADLCDTLNQVRPAQAIDYCRDALAIADRWSKRIIPDSPLATYASTMQRLGRIKEAEDTLRRSIELRQQLVTSDPTFFNKRLDLIRARNQMAGILVARGDRVGALEQYRQMLSMGEAMVAAKPDHLLARRDLADTYEALGRYYETEDRQQAAAWYRKSLAIWSAWTPSTRMDQRRREHVGRSLSKML
jgi:tetratricopeptide (TPR) repeat protein